MFLLIFQNFFFLFSLLLLLSLEMLFLIFIEETFTDRSFSLKLKLKWYNKYIYFFNIYNYYLILFVLYLHFFNNLRIFKIIFFGSYANIFRFLQNRSKSPEQTNFQNYNHLSTIHCQKAIWLYGCVHI